MKIGFSKLMLGPTVGTGMKSLAGIARAVEMSMEAGQAIEGHARGQFIASISGDVLEFAKTAVTCGDARHTNEPTDYINRRHWTGKVVQCLPRSFAGETKSILLIFSTMGAYLADPDTLKDPVETARIVAENPDWVVVWVVAAAETTEMPGDVFLRNLAGANNEARLMTADEIRAQAARSVARDAEWCSVAD